MYNVHYITCYCNTCAYITLNVSPSPRNTLQECLHVPYFTCSYIILHVTVTLYMFLHYFTCVCDTLHVSLKQYTLIIFNVLSP